LNAFESVYSFKQAGSARSIKEEVLIRSNEVYEGNFFKTVESRPLSFFSKVELLEKPRKGTK